MATERTAASHGRVPGRKPGPEHLGEVGRIWGAVDDDARKMILFLARSIARNQGLVAAETPLLITECVF